MAWPLYSSLYRKYCRHNPWLFRFRGICSCKINCPCSFGVFSNACNSWPCLKQARWPDSTHNSPRRLNYFDPKNLYLRFKVFFPKAPNSTPLPMQNIPDMKALIVPGLNKSTNKSKIAMSNQLIPHIFLFVLKPHYYFFRELSIVSL